MESSRPSPSDPDRPVDPGADLAMLDETRSSVITGEILDFGPWWYAPLIAALIGGAALFGRDTGTEAILFGALGLVCGAIVIVHDRRRRRVRLRPSRRTAVVVVPVFVLTVLAAGAWGAAASVIGDDRFVPGPAIVAWALTTGLFLGVRWVLLALRRRSAMP